MAGSASPQIQKKKRPRTCVGCMEESPKRELLRVIKSPEGQVRYDPTGRANGRGAYVCAQLSCVEAARKKKALSRALKAETPDAVYDELAEVCRQREQPDAAE